MTKLSAIEGIGGAYSDKLGAAGINTMEVLLDKCCSKKGRKEVAEASGVSEKLILGWINRADLSRVKGISTQYADLLKFAGVDTVPELAQRNATNLHAKIVEVNEQKKLVRKLPTASQIEQWVGQAKELPRIITH